MFFPLLFLILLVFAAPITIIFDGLVAKAVIGAIAAISAAKIGVRIRPGEAGFLLAVIRPVALVAAVPAIWMLVQLAPLESIGLAHPIWKSAAVALGRPLAGSISIDPGITLVSLVQYLSTFAILLIAGAVAVDRRRAEWVLFGLMASTTLVALMALAVRFSLFALPASVIDEQSDSSATAISGFGIIFALATLLHVFERRETERPDQIRSGTNWSTLAACLAAFIFCCLAVILIATSQTNFAIFCGVATLAVSVIIRRFEIRSWGIAAITSIVAFVAIAVIALQSNTRTVDLSLAFASQAPPSLITTTQRILTETGWEGTGAGTFPVVLPIYRDINELASGRSAPTAAAVIAIEMGQPFLWAALLATIALVLKLLRGALRRRRDPFYSIAGASCVVVTALLSFGTSAPLSTSVSIIIATAVGMGIVQSKSRSP